MLECQAHRDGRAAARPGRWLVGALLVASCTWAMAQKPPNISAGELALLPSYCPDTQTMSDVDPRGSEQGRYWVGILGPAFWALHHYCWGLIHVHRAKNTGVPAMQRRWHLETAINDYRYVLANSQPDFVLLPELHLRIGEAYVELQAPASALEAFMRSRQVKPDYWPAYTRAAAVLTKAGRNAEALETLREGLVHAPHEPALVQAYTKAGGDHARFLDSQARTAAASAAASSAASSRP